MGFCLVNSYFTKFRPLYSSSGLLRTSYPVVTNDVRGIKQSINEKLNIPAKPKKPLTPFFKYMVEHRPFVVKENPNLPVKDVVKIIAQRWSNADSKLKENLEVQFQKEKEVYEKTKMHYYSNLTDEQKAAIQEEKIRVTDLKNKRILKQKAKELNKPKKSLSAFMLYSASRMNSRGDIPLPTYQKQMGKEWQSLEETVKNKYLLEAKERYAAYTKEIAKWEEKMMKLGHVDLLRNESLLHSPKLASRKK